MTIRTYQDAADYLGRKQNRPLPGRASRIIRRSETAIAIRYQSTDVVTYHAGGPTILQSGGWLSVTTKARMTEYTRARIYSDKGVWYVSSTHGWEGPRSLYYDGMAVTDDGLPVDPRFPTPTDTERKRKLDKAVSTYIKGFAADIAEHGLKDPSGGDCWGCCMQAQNQPTVTQGEMRLQGKATPHGRIEVMGISHYWDHFRESYFVPSLLANAIKAAGYRNPGFIWQMIQSRKDGDMAARILRGYFRNLKPALLKEMDTAA